MKIFKIRPFSLALTLLVVAGCHKNDEFMGLTYRNDPPAKTFDQVHKIKELSTNATIDIVWVIDNSASMDVHQKDVINNTAKFMNIFTTHPGINWKMGLLSTDTRDNPYLGFGTEVFDSKTKDPITVFQQAAMGLGLNGSGIEKSFAPVLKNLTKFKDFARPGAIFATIFVTDASEQSGISAANYMAQLKQLIPSATSTIGYAVLGPQDWCTPTDDPYYDYKGSPYEIYISATGGKAYKICDPDFGVSLSDMANDLVSKLSRPRIYLQSRPKIDSLRVTYKDAELPAGQQADGGQWYYDFVNNAIVFYDLAFAPGDQEEVKVHYVEDDGLPLQK